MKGSEWANKYFYISPEAGVGSLIKWECFPYQIGILDAMTDPTLPIVIIRKSARIGYTMMMGIATCITIQNNPHNTLLIQPTIEDAQGYSKDFLVPMFRDIPEISQYAPAEKSRDSDSTILRKKFPGMILYLVGANSPRGFRRISAGTILADEISAWPAQAGKEGEQLLLSLRRSEWFLNPKAIIGSTPTDVGECKITELWEQSDKQEYFWPCPSCGELQFFKWGQFDFSDRGTEKKPLYICEHCDIPIGYDKHRWIMERGVWKPTEQYKEITGFYPWSAMSYSPNATWAHLVSAFLKSKDDPIKLKTWVNTWKGDAWEEKGESLNPQFIYDAREDYSSINNSAGVIIGSVDTQDDRLEVLFRAWGKDEESWGIEHQVLVGDPGKVDVWNRLDSLLQKTFQREDGNPLSIMACGIDRGGHHADMVDQFVRSRFSRNIFAIQGRALAEKPIVGKPSKKNKGRVPLFTFNTDALKNIYMSRLKSGGIGKIHYNMSFSADFCEQLTVEHRKIKYKYGQRFFIWEKKKHARNEAFDLEVYNLGVLRILYRDPDLLNKYLSTKKWEPKIVQKEKEIAPEHKTIIKNPIKRRKNYINSWKNY